MVSRYSISVSDELGKRLDYFLSKHRREYDTVASYFQELIEHDLNPGNRYYINIFMLYLGYPVILLTVLFKAAVDTRSLIYTYISMLICGLLLAGLYLFVTKHRGKG
jgi:predicted DNA-binding protein